jgi:FkbM family methyltransferase
MRFDQMSLLGRVLGLFGKKIVFQSEYHELVSQRIDVGRFRKIQQVAQESSNSDLVHFLVLHALDSHAQQLQDLLAAYFSNRKPGYFVEFGATDGIDLSNTFLLEERFGWTGIIAEPAKMWHKNLHENRNCSISEDCVYSVSGQDLVFSEATSGKLSTLNKYVNSDEHVRESSSEYSVRSVSLEDLLHQFRAPLFIDFLSIDTEGSEFEIIRNFDFDKYEFGFICIEHNHTENDQKIESLLKQNGYIRILRESSDFDGWYLNPNLLQEFT